MISIAKNPKQQKLSKTKIKQNRKKKKKQPGEMDFLHFAVWEN